ncbi:CbtB-domain containing protein [Pseudonocardia sp. C8]|uniref:CbtB domain-containing protein n=1 Tax=Pseudonocardia sp. C8 TaxID=2762759 RepID=UPI0016425965|nr:CbtB-domain containing protein [Pseudonocardia sp. C8]MBC3195023.1 CbtB-domain containing protein [Pseudonocardia sp. C8]
MTHAVADVPGAVPAPIPLREIAPWALFAGTGLLVLLYLVGLDQGVTSLVPGEMIHEFVHDGRHLLAFPCH